MRSSPRIARGLGSDAVLVDGRFWAPVSGGDALRDAAAFCGAVCAPATEVGPVVVVPEVAAPAVVEAAPVVPAALVPLAVVPPLTVPPVAAVVVLDALLALIAAPRLAFACAAAPIAALRFVVAVCPALTAAAMLAALPEPIAVFKFPSAVCAALSAVPRFVCAVIAALIAFCSAACAEPVSPPRNVTADAIVVVSWELSVPAVAIAAVSCAWVC